MGADREWGMLEHQRSSVEWHAPENLSLHFVRPCVLLDIQWLSEHPGLETGGVFECRICDVYRPTGKGVQREEGHCQILT